MTTLIDQMISSTTESNISMRHQIKQQHLSLKKLEAKLRDRNQAQLKKTAQLKIPAGKMVIKPKSMVMRVRNDKAILDELGQTKHRADSDSDDNSTLAKTPKFDPKSVPNLIIQSEVSCTPASSMPNNGALLPNPTSVPYAAPPAPVYNYSTPPNAHYPPMMYQPVPYVNEYLHEPPIYKIRSRSHARAEPPVIIYEHERSPPPSVHYHRPRPAEYRPYREDRYSGGERWGYDPDSPPKHRSKHSPPSYEHEERYERRGEHYAASYPPTHHMDGIRKHTAPRSSSGVIKHDIRRHGDDNRPHPSDIRQSGTHFRVMVSNLHPSVTIHDIEELFSAIDRVEHIQMKFPGVAEVTYLREESAIRSIDNYHNRDLDGQPMQVTYSITQSPRKAGVKTKQPLLTTAPNTQRWTKKPRTAGEGKMGETRRRAARPPSPQQYSDQESLHSFTVTV